MSKVINISSTENEYTFKCDGAEIISISKENLIIDGKKLFENFISNFDISSGISFEFIDDENITDSNEKRIIKDVKDILIKIAEKINQKIQAPTSEIDEMIDEDNEDVEKSHQVAVKQV